MGCGIKDIGKFREKLEKLDEISPYENGFTYQEVSSVVTLPSREGNELQMILVNDYVDCPRRIVEVITIEHGNGKTSLIPSWDLTGIIF